MTLPLTRNTTYTPEAPVKSYDLNDLQDKMIDAWAGQHGDVTTLMPLTLGFPTNPANWTPTGLRWDSLAAGSIGFQLPLCNGDRLREVRAVYSKEGAGTSCSIALAYQITSAGADSSSFNFTVPITASGSATWAELVMDCNDTMIGAPSESPGDVIQALVVFFSTDGAGNILGQLKYTFDHPPP
jgi:hypothetical protein